MKKDSKKEIKILQNGDPTLRLVSTEVKPLEMQKDSLKNIISDMKKAMSSQEDAIALSAIQIGIPKRIFIISNKIYEIIEKTAEKKEREYLIFINPKIKKFSKEKDWAEEGCLSVRYLYGKVNRSKKVSIEAQDANGKNFSLGASGLLAQIIQHENDHLDGILFIDKAIEIQEILPENHRPL